MIVPDLPRLHQWQLGFGASYNGALIANAILSSTSLFLATIYFTMPLQIQVLAASKNFWHDAAKAILAQVRGGLLTTENALDLSALRVVVPTFVHSQSLMLALQVQLGRDFIPPQIHTLFAWRQMQMPSATSISPQSERLMRLYGELRQHAWLKKLFGVKRNTELLPLAQSLLSLFDELSQAWLPQALQSPLSLESDWLRALSQLSLPVQKILADETQLVWTLWQAQLDRHDPSVREFEQMMSLAEQADAGLVWISPAPVSVLERAFLEAYQVRRPVLLLQLDWRVASLPSLLVDAWPTLGVNEAINDLGFAFGAVADVTDIADIAGNPDRQQRPFSTSQLRLFSAHSLEDEAQHAAQTITDWLLAGKQKIAVIAQDRLVARRLRALLERSSVHVADETGWKLSTTRAAAALSAWFEVCASRGDTMALLDFLKSPFLRWPKSKDLADGESVKADAVMAIEFALREANVTGAWESVIAVFDSAPALKDYLCSIETCARHYLGNGRAVRRSLREWTALSLQVLSQLNMFEALNDDHAGEQVLRLLQTLNTECAALESEFSFSEWRALMYLQMEQTPFVVDHPDTRVVMLPLNGARLRIFDAVLMLGADAQHLPSRAQETLFFSNALKRECGLQTREMRQQQQLRDFAEMLLSNDELVLSWQAELNGELNAPSPWIAQIELSLLREGREPLAQSALHLSECQLTRQVQVAAAPSAPSLLPSTLSASAWSSLVACPYQFFAGRMLHLSALDDLSDQPAKRDYGDWLHAILKIYHERLRSENTPMNEERTALLNAVSDDFFRPILQQSPAALGYSVRWKKVIPAYVKWANQRDHAAWRFEEGEVWAERDLHWKEGSIRLRGRIDRIDHRESATPISDENQGQARGYAVLDYKTKRVSELRQRLRDFEDPQLPFYGLLAQDRSDHAAYVALELESKQIAEVPAPHYGQWKLALEQSMCEQLGAIAKGASLPAHGIENVCQYCDMRGLCRKGAW